MPETGIYQNDIALYILTVTARIAVWLFLRSVSSAGSSRFHLRKCQCTYSIIPHQSPTFPLGSR